tara:strand:- start:439 stop:615 length:177 start_codon:yes stop_codon:yes gene_type:complete
MDTGSAINQYFWFETIVPSANAAATTRLTPNTSDRATTISVTNSAHRADALTSVGKSP